MMLTDSNILFKMFMGEKYLITDHSYNKLYKLMYKDKDINIYYNDDVLPIGYASSKVINEKEFDNIDYPSNIINMLGKVVLDDDTNVDILNLKPIDLDYKVLSSSNLEYKKIDSLYIVNAKDNAKLKLKINDDLTNKLLFIRFDMLKTVNCGEKELGIKINDTYNKLTCNNWKYKNNNTTFDYVDIFPDTLDIKFNKGNYKIGNISIYSLNYDIIKDVNKSVDYFNINKAKTYGDTIKGDINVTSDSYFTISIPYDKGFNILVDNKEIDYFKVNKAFIGFSIDKGKHNIEIEYHAPYKNIGLVISFLGIVFSIILIKWEKKNNKYID